MACADWSCQVSWERGLSAALSKRCLTILPDISAHSVAGVFLLAVLMSGLVAARSTGEPATPQHADSSLLRQKMHSSSALRGNASATYRPTENTGTTYACCETPSSGHSPRTPAESPDIVSHGDS